MLSSAQEVKRLATVASGSVVVSTGGTISNLSLIAQGDDIANRSGDVINMHDIDLRMIFFQGTPAASASIRIILFTDGMGSGATVGVSELLLTANITSPYNPVNAQRHRFKILRDETIVVVGATEKQEVNIVWHNAINQRRYFNDATATATAVGKNTLYILVIGSTTVPIFSIQHSLQYTDS